MMSQSIAGNGQDRKFKVHPYKFTLWVGLASILMLFAAFTSAYVVRRAQGDWAHFELPEMFWITTFIILISSATMHLSLRSAKKDNFTNVILGLGITLMLGIAFVIGQVVGWFQLTQSGTLLSGNPSGSFVYVISGMHALHIIGGIVFLLVLFIRSMIKNKISGAALINSKRLVAIEMCATYWHFVGGLWIYLFLFLLINR